MALVLYIAEGFAWAACRGARVQARVRAEGVEDEVLAAIDHPHKLQVVDSGDVVMGNESSDYPPRRDTNVAEMPWGVVGVVGGGWPLSHVQHC
jgi:hypothetical protein